MQLCCIVCPPSLFYFLATGERVLSIIAQGKLTLSCLERQGILSQFDNSC